MEESGSEHVSEEQISRVVNELYRVTNENYRIRRELYMVETPPPTSPSRSSIRSPTGPTSPTTSSSSSSAFSSSASSSDVVSPASSAAPSPTPSHATSPVPSPAPSPPPHPNPPAVHFELVPDVELTPRGPRISVTFKDPDAVPFMSDTDSDSCVPTAPAAEREHQDRREVTSDSDSEMDWSSVRPVTPRFTLSLPHGDSPEHTRRPTADTVAEVISWVASNLDFIPPTYPRRRPRRLPRGRPRKYKRRTREH
ncbi:hypothetical protein M8J76_006956 [Diaphorina citri]|nr:hypothetical protein M8J76_006956 [Diaphorina citri]